MKNLRQRVALLDLSLWSGAHSRRSHRIYPIAADAASLFSEHLSAPTLK